jgi:hypothetical protein
MSSAIARNPVDTPVGQSDVSRHHDGRREMNNSPTSNKQAALDAFLARKAEIDAMLARLTQLSEGHFGTSPDEITWGDVGMLAQQLRSITDQAFQEGEHSV